MAGKTMGQRDGIKGRVKVWGCTAFYTMFLLNITTLSQAVAGPDGGQVVGGTGSIVHSGTTTTINQSTQNMAIDWQSYNVNVNERVQYIQPNASSISLNRILSQSGSTIAGRIDANGQVILVNPNGVFFTPTAVINVGGIIASGLDIQPNDFMNGHYIFDEVLGTDGTVINSGMINASLGGNVALIGKQVENDGLIVANLGAVTLAAGKQAVLTFDPSGLLGVRVSKEILQDELGIDPAVINNGDIQAEGGRVLLTASTSQDVFSQAVNTGNLDQATSVVVHEDGSFTLGGGADVINAGSIDTSTTANDQDIGRIVLIGENVTSSGELLANASNGNGGEIELHAQNTTLLTEDSVTSARSETNGQGGIVKILGDRVGLFDQSTVDVSGANGGGQALIGGDFQGNNADIRNARFTKINQDARLFADALVAGDGGTIISWGDEYTEFYGMASARGGQYRGDGGLVEISGKGLGFDGMVDTRAINGVAGRLLFDPLDIIIFDGVSTQEDDNQLPSFDRNAGNSSSVFKISEGALEAISATTNISLQATRNITINDLADGTLSLQTASGNFVTFTADADGDGLGNFTMIDTSDILRTQGGGVSIVGASITAGKINTSGIDGGNGGNISVGATNGNITVGVLTSSGGAATAGSGGNDAGNITLFTGDTDGINDRITLNGNIIADGSDADGANIGGEAGSILLRTGDAAGGEDRITFNGDRIISAQGGNSTNASNVGLHNVIDIDTPLLVTNGAITLTTERTRSYSGSAQGDISLAFDDAGTARVAQVTLGGNLTATAGQASDVNFSTAINYNGILAGTLTLNAGNDVAVVGAMSDFDTNTADLLNISLNANTDGGSNGDVIINGIQNTDVSINTGGGAYLVTGVNYVGESTTSSKRTVDTGAAGNANINVAGYAQLGEMDVGGTLDVTAGSAYAGNSITQGTNGSSNDTLTVMGAASFVSTASTGSIDLANNNNLQAAISLTTTGAGADATLNNTATTTTLDTLNIGGGLTVNADQNLTLANDITVNGMAQLNFGQDNSDGNIFTASSGLASSTLVVNGGTGADIFNLVADIAGQLNGNAGNDVFNFLPGLTGTTYTGTADGGQGGDSFIISGTGITFTDTLDGGSGSNDTLTAANEANYWLIEGLGNGIYANTGDRSTASNVRLRFSDIENVTGNTGVDDFLIGISGSIEKIDGGGSGSNTLTGRNGDNTWTIGATNSLADTSTYVANFINIDTLIGGSAVDTFDITAAYSGNINGGDNNDIFTLEAEIQGTINGGTGDDTFTINADVSGTLNGNEGNDSFTILQPALTINQIDGGSANQTTGDELIAANGANYWTVDGINGGALYSDSDRTLTPITFSNIENLTGNTGTDDFLIDATGTVSQIDGDGGANSLTGRDADNTWNITSTGNSLAVTNGNTYVGSFSNISTLTGGTGTGVDTFSIETGATIATLNGQGGNDQFTVNGAVNTLNGGDDLDTIDVNAGGTVTTLNGNAGTDTITISGASTSNTGRVTTLNGGAGNDVITVASNGRITTALNGDAGADSITVSATSGTDYGEVAELSGGADADTITIDSNARVSGTITGNDGGDVITVNGTVASVAAGEGIDTIMVNNGGRVTGAIDTGGDADTITVDGINGAVASISAGGGDDTITVNNADTVSGVIAGGAGRDELTLTDNSVTLILGAGVEQIETVIAAGGDAGALTGTDNGNTWNVSSSGNTVTDTTTGDVTTFSGFSVLNAGTGGDDFNITTPGISEINGNTGIDDITLDSSGLVATINGGGNTDSLAIDTGNNLWAVDANNDGNVKDIETLLNVTDFTSIETRIGSVAGTNNIDLSALGTDTVLLAGYQNFDLLIGSGNGTLQGIDGQQNDWRIQTVAGAPAIGTAGVDDGTVTVGSVTTRFINFKDLTGGNADDTFTIASSGSLTGMIYGGGGNNTLTGADVTNAWRVTGSETGSLAYTTTDSAVTAFSGIQNITGGTSNDTFTFDANGRLSGLLDGGVGSDSVDMSALAAVDITLGQGLVNIESITGNGTNSTLRGTNTANTFILTGDNDGTLDSLAFVNFNALDGGDGNDVFTFLTGSRLSGLLDGGVGSDSVDMSALAAVDITLGQGLANIEQITGNDTNSILRGTAAANTFILTGDNDGTLDSLAFVNFNALDGGDGNDSFTFGVNGSLMGLLDGGAGSDDVDMSALAVVDITLGQGLANIESIMGNNSNSTLRGTADANTFVLTGANNGTLDGNLAFTNFTQLNGGDGDDTFTYQTTGSLSGLLDGGAGSDSVDLSALAVVDITPGQGLVNIEQITGNDSDSTLRGTVAANVFILNGENDGTLDNSLTFTNFTQLDGGDGDDTFTFQANGRLAGLLEGGAGSDRVDMSLVSGALSVTQGTDINNIETLNGNNNDSTLIGTDAANVFILNGENNGTLDDTLAFTGFTDLNGGGGNDTFTFQATGRLSGLLEGGAGSDRVDMSLVTRALSVTQGQDINNIETLTGNDNSTLIGTAAANAFILSGENSGTLDNSLTFTDVNQLDGGDGDDTFTFGANGRLTGLLDGGAGSDRVDMSLVTRALSITQGQDINNIETLTGNDNSTLIGTAAANAFILSGENSGTLDNSLAFTRVNRLDGEIGRASCRERV